MDDIVTRLRQEWEYGNNAKGCDYEMFSQAADEIERLRSLIKDFVSACEIDRFGHVHDVDFGDLTQAYKNSIEVLK